MPRKKEAFVLVSLQEDQAKKLAQVVSNDTCRRVLNHLADREATESELAKALDLPISTIHYNLGHLQKGKLVEAEEFHYSEKGKEVLHYRLANKYIIIAPKSTFGLKEKLRNILPVALVTAGVAFVIQIVQKYSRTMAKFGSAPMQEGARVMQAAVPEAAPVIAEKALEVGEEAVADLAYGAGAETVNETVDQLVTQVMPPIVEVVKEPTIWQNPALWFVIGAVSSLALYLLFSYLLRKK